ncbi:hypothetical protein HIM_06667 [Hirsutella minnesotensis 3608]|uniref:tyrosinase n=1 Tax=Hirsutella minnesotensis 3608 TaxID=1043627 RepID=A0A0F8A4Q7_9HYPO|nr:hypothetical protein HIM_06667 [Hirsutella minnesotensis 3608]
MFTKVIKTSALALALFISAAQAAPPPQHAHPVTGVPIGKQTAPPLRKDINQLHAAGGPQWDLYLLALGALQGDGEEDPLSYFQLSGIHGKPFIEWNGAGPGVDVSWGGYCPHAENMFLPWHRAYLALFEQVLVERAKKIAAQYPVNVRPRYLQAAETLRIPYWDWSADSVVPPSTVPDTIRVNATRGNKVKEVQIENPLRVYKIPKAAVDGKYGPFDPLMRTKIERCTAPRTWPGSANKYLSENIYRQWTYEFLTRSRDFTEFSFGGGYSVSLEQIHNNIHWDATCGEQFFDNGLAAFDPLFMLHHAHVDRIWAFWQALRPDEDIFKNSYPGNPRFATKMGATINPDSPMQPFFQPSGAFHTSLTVRSIHKLGYSYEGLQASKGSQEQVKQDVMRIVNRIYGTGSVATASLESNNQPEMRYVAQVRVNRTEVERPYRIDVLLDGKRAGSYVVPQGPAVGMEQGSFGLDSVKTGDAALAFDQDKTKGSNSTFAVEVVKASPPDGSKIPLKDMSSLHVEVEAMEMTPPSTDKELPRYGATSLHKVIL